MFSRYLFCLFLSGPFTQVLLNVDIIICYWNVNYMYPNSDPANNFVLKMSTYQSNALQNTFTMETNTMNPDLKKQSDLGPYCLQYSLPKLNKQI